MDMTTKRPMRSMRPLRPMFFALALVLAGCGNLGAPAQQFAYFDLGLAEPVDPPPRLAPSQVEVRAPSWLSSGAMQYRIDYRQPAQREAYSETRWVAEPAEMLRVGLGRALTASRPAAGACRLRIELDEFVQVFASENASYARIIVRAGLLGPAGDADVARRTFVIDEAAPRPDAPGGVIAHRRAVQRLAEDLSGWLAGIDPADSQGLNSIGRCER